jgi:predicted SAM-dependent methyltransferase
MVSFIQAELSGARPVYRVLDLGANPYILTYTLVSGSVDVVSSGAPLPSGAPSRAGERVEFRTATGSHVASVPLHRFNVERDRFPFDDESFDAVLCGELLEHLIETPDRMLFECNRVLAIGGRLVLSTPNAVSLTRIISMIRGASGEWPFSEQGPYARHNRLYTIGEVRDLLNGHGFSIKLLQGLTYIHRRSWYAKGPVGAAKWLFVMATQQLFAQYSRRQARWADSLLVVAIKQTPPSRYRPSWLFGATDTVPMVA